MDVDRRVADEQFRREIAERQKALEKSFEYLASQIKDQKDDIRLCTSSITDLRYKLFGGPDTETVGLIEGFRNMATRDRWIIWIVAAAIGFTGKLVSPIYDKLVADWAYNSTTERWAREQKRPIIKHYHVRIQAPKTDDDTPD